MVIDEESKNKNNLSTADLLHCHRLLVCMSFLIKVSGVKDNINKAGYKVIFSRPGSQMIIQSVFYFVMSYLKAITCLHQDVVLN